MAYGYLDITWQNTEKDIIAHFFLDLSNHFYWTADPVQQHESRMRCQIIPQQRWTALVTDNMLHLSVWHWQAPVTEAAKMSSHVTSL